jgi:hypothetical protein
VKTKKTEVNIPSHWRIQGSSIRHSGIGEKLTQEDAGAIMELLREQNFFGKYNPDTGTIQNICREGSVKESGDLLYQLWEKYGSESVKIAQRQSAELVQQKKEAERVDAMASELDRLSTEVAWIDQALGEAEMNDYNKLTLAKYLAGESDQVPMVNWKWAEPLKRLNAIKGEGPEQRVDFEVLRSTYYQYQWIDASVKILETDVFQSVDHPTAYGFLKVEILDKKRDFLLEPTMADPQKLIFMKDAEMEIHDLVVSALGKGPIDPCDPGRAGDRAFISVLQKNIIEKSNIENIRLEFMKGDNCFDTGAGPRM